MKKAAPLIPLSADVLSRTPPEVIELLRRLLAENQELREEIVRLRAMIEELEARLNKNSSNSNKPPSSDSAFSKKPMRPKRQRSRASVKERASNVCARPN